MTKFVNLTHHEISIVDENGKEIWYSGGNGSACLSIEYTPQGTLPSQHTSYFDEDGPSGRTFDVEIPIVHASVKSIHGLPEPKHGVIYIVPPDVAREANRHDVVTTNGNRQVTRLIRF